MIQIEQEGIMDRKYLTYTETMEFLRLSRPTVSRLIARKEIPSYKIGRLRLFDREELIEWVKGHREGLGSKPKSRKVKKNTK
jgi:excisionase family DNA binding protein